MPYTIAGIDVHKKVLMVVVADMSAPKRSSSSNGGVSEATTNELLRFGGVAAGAGPCRK